MIWDPEFDGDQPKPRVISEWTYYGTFWAVACSLMFLEALALGRLAIWLRTPALNGAVGGLALPNMVLARYLVGAWLRRRGLTRAGKPTAIITHVPLLPTGTPEAEVVEVAPSGWIWFAAAVLGAVGLFGFGGGVAISRHLGTGGPLASGEWLSIALAVGSGLMLVFYGVVVPLLDPRTIVDATGVSGYPRDLAIRRRFIPWSAIAAAEVETIHNLAGSPRLIRPILYDSAGRRIIRLDTIGLRLADQERLIRAIQARLPRMGKSA